MNISAFSNALHILCATPLHLGAGLTGAMLLRLADMCLQLFTAIGELVHREADPRLSLGFAQRVEDFARRVHREQLATALDLEITGANALSLEVFDQIKAETSDFDGEAERCSGKPCYRSAEDLIASWLNLNYFTAAGRIADAHLLVGRRTAQGTRAPARMPHLAELYASGAADPDQLAVTARKLAKLEPKDQIFEGTPIELQARNDDGELLEERFARFLDTLGPRSARKQVNTELASYRDKHSEELPPPRGLFIGPVKQGVHEFKLRTNAAQAQILHSIMAQSASRRTQAGKEARKEQQPDPVPVPDWLIADAPLPEWAQAQDSSEHVDGGAADQQADPEAGQGPQPCGNSGAADANGVDAEVDPALRKLNALMAVLGTSTAGPGSAKCITPQVVVYMWLHDLYHLSSSHGVTSNAVDIPPGELRRILAEANIIPIVLGGNSQPLDVGRSQRFHTGAIRTAIMARDRGCIVPDCTTPPDQVEIDHYQRDWADGGTTSVDSGAAMCTDGHHSRHVGHIRVVDIDGLPHVILPPHIDPEQIPRRNTYWGGLQLGDAPPDSDAAGDEPA